MRLMLTLPLLLLAACSPKPDTPLQISGPLPSKQSVSRFVVERVGVIEDELAYYSRRGLYLIRDTKTGQEFVGLSGVGVSELGRHQSGKATVADER
jgi:hypothetical protein